VKPLVETKDISPDTTRPIEVRIEARRPLEVVEVDAVNRSDVLRLEVLMGEACHSEDLVENRLFIPTMMTETTSSASSLLVITIISI